MANQPNLLNNIQNFEPAFLLRFANTQAQYLKKLQFDRRTQRADESFATFYLNLGELAPDAHPGDDNDPNLILIRNDDIKTRLVEGAYHAPVLNDLIKFERQGIRDNAGVRIRAPTVVELEEAGQELENDALRTEHIEGRRSIRGTVDLI